MKKFLAAIQHITDMSVFTVLAVSMEGREKEKQVFGKATC